MTRLLYLKRRSCRKEKTVVELMCCVDIVDGVFNLTDLFPGFVLKDFGGVGTLI